MAIVAPLLIPAVLDFPILFAVEGAIANHGDSMASEVITGGCMIHTRLIGLKVRVHVEGDVHWAIGYQLLHNRLFATHAVS
jgi:hypothetical protein